MKKMNSMSIKQILRKAKDVYNDFFKEKEYDSWGADIILKSANVGYYQLSDHFPPNSIIFTVKKEEMMRISEEGFFWKGNLIENDKEIYSIVKEFNILF